MWVKDVRVLSYKKKIYNKRDTRKERWRGEMEGWRA
jgi:hypothetical protein